VRAEARCADRTDFKGDRHRRASTVLITGRQNKKARTILADLSGYPACAEPTSSVVRRSRAYNKPLS
jgi:hypothetical protein